eukprot:56844-Alexandrium_andersonii.AAC.1
MCLAGACAKHQQGYAPQNAAPGLCSLGARTCSRALASLRAMQHRRARPRPGAGIGAARAR